ncbi:MAG: recombination mediator RecR [Bacillales bacterium]|jgi:recombination protein RecR|nr:recombination mediator RecR [Bacillales bacterium]
MKYPLSFENLINHLKKLPSIGGKSAERLAYHILAMKPEEASEFAQSISTIGSVIHSCKVCNCICEDDLCEICKDLNRDKTLLCVVQSSKDAYVLANVSSFTGYFHVLNGVISIKNGIGPDRLNISSLLERVKQDNVKEVIIATNPNLDGETTALFLAKLLEKQNVSVSRLAYGLPVNGNIDYADEVTLGKALSGRQKI